MGINSSKGSVIPDLPDFIIEDMVSALPIKSILRCRCVCKTWLNLISSSYFNDLILKKRSSLTFILEARPQIPTRQYFLFQFQHRTDLTETDNCPVEPMKLSSKLFPGVIKILGNCNGLLCLLDMKTLCHIHLWNPVLGQYITFPIDLELKSTTMNYGFGYNHISNQYKVIRIVPRETFSVVEVLTLGINIWTRVGNTHCRPNFGQDNFCYSTGIIHWICGCGDDSHAEWIGFFNISTEKLAWITPPSDCIGHERGRDHFELKVVRDHLCLLHYTHKGLVLWSMNNYGGAESWSKHVVWESQNPLQFLSVARMWGDEEFLFLWTHGGFRYFDSKEMRTMDLKITTGGFIKTDAFPFSPSFVPLFDIFNQEPSKVFVRKRWVRRLFPFLKCSTSK